MRRGDVAAFRRGLAGFDGVLARRDPQELTEVVAWVAPLLDQATGVFVKLAVLAGACVEYGGSPLPLTDVLPQRAAVTMQTVAVFPAVWSRATRRRPLPSRDSTPMDEVE